MSNPKTRPPRTVRPAAPPMPPFEALDRTHRQVIETLGLFEQLLARLETSGADDMARASAAAIGAFFTDHARQHHADEEKFIFPDLLTSGDAVMVQHVRRLQQDHGWLEEDWLELAPQFEAIALGYNWYDLGTLRLALPVFRALYEEHIGLEESLVYPAAKRRQELARQGAEPVVGAD